MLKKLPTYLVADQVSEVAVVHLVLLVAVSVVLAALVHFFVDQGLGSADCLGLYKIGKCFNTTICLF